MSWMRNSKRPINRIVANTTPHLRARGGYGALAGEEEQAKPKRVQVEVQSPEPGSGQVTMCRGVVAPETGTPRNSIPGVKG